jgi:hypothetical protein
MTLTVETPRLNDLAEVVATLGEWQHTLGPVQLHPGDLGWFSLRGEAVLATRLRAWRRNGALVALGLLDEPDLLRMAVAPEIDADRDIAAQLVTDLESSAAGVLPQDRPRWRLGRVRHSVSDCGSTAGSQTTRGSHCGGI